MKFTYGLPQSTDLEDMYAVETTCFDDAEQMTYDEFKLNLTNHRKTSVVVKDNSGKVVGIMIGTPVVHEHLDNDDYVAADLKGNKTYPYLAILSLAVLPTFQGHGIAGQLLRRTLLLAKLMNKQAVVLDCVKDLIPYYTAHRFQTNGRSNSQFGTRKWYSMIHPI